MGFVERNDRARHERDDGHMHIVAQVGRVHEAGGGPAAIGARHLCGRDVLLLREKNASGGGQAIDRDVAFTDPVKDGAVGRVDQPCGPGGKIAKPARGQAVGFFPPSAISTVPSTTKIAPSAFGSVSGRLLPPPGEISTMYCENVSAKPLSGRRQHPEARLVPKWQGTGYDIRQHPRAG